MVSILDVVEIPRNVREMVYPKLLSSSFIALILKGAYPFIISDLMLMVMVLLTLGFYFLSKVKLEHVYHKYLSKSSNVLEIINNFDTLTEIHISYDSIPLIVYGSLTTILFVTLLLKLLETVKITLPCYVLLLILTVVLNYLQFSKIYEHSDTVGGATDLVMHKIAMIPLSGAQSKLQDNIHWVYIILQWLLWLAMPIMYGLIPDVSMDMVIVHIEEKDNVSKLLDKIKSRLTELVIHSSNGMAPSQVSCDSVDVENLSIWEWVTILVERGLHYEITHKYSPTQKAIMSVTCVEYRSHSKMKKTAVVILLFGDGYIVRKMTRMLKLHLPILSFRDIEYFAALSGLPPWCFSPSMRRKYFSGYY